MSFVEHVIQSKKCRIHLLNYGATVTKFICRDSEDHEFDIVLGFDNHEGYLQRANPYVNCIVGRYSNRIGNASFPLNDEIVKVAANFGKHQLHGGFHGVDKKYWEVVKASESSITYGVQCEDGEDGFPGNLKIEVTYEIRNDNELHILYDATTDKATPVNLTNHCYFNLSGEDNILDHELEINSEEITETDQESITTGKFLKVAGTIYDLRIPKKLKDQFKEVDGYDNNWVLGDKIDKPKYAASLYYRKSNRALEVYTTEPGLQIYTSNYFDNTLTNTKYNKQYGKFAAICLETQMLPNSVNHPHFPNTILQPGERYHQHTIYKVIT